MAPARRMMIVLAAALGLLWSLGWTATAIACPVVTVTASSAAHGDGCGHAPAPARPQSPNHEAQLCAVCIAVLPPPMQIAENAVPPSAALPSRLQPLSGIAPKLDPPPPRAA
jgi:hypothetical protein